MSSGPLRRRHVSGMRRISQRARASLLTSAPAKDGFIRKRPPKAVASSNGSMVIVWAAMPARRKPASSEKGVGIRRTRSSLRRRVVSSALARSWRTRILVRMIPGPFSCFIR